jgi:hypothetical protein
MVDWQPIETAPKDGTPILLWAARQRVDSCGAFSDFNDPHVHVAAWVDEPFSAAGLPPGHWEGDAVTLECGGEDTWTAAIYLAPTHWMPLPQPPKP